MTKNTKRVLSLVLVVVMLMGMGKTTFAVENSQDKMAELVQFVDNNMSISENRISINSEVVYNYIYQNINQNSISENEVYTQIIHLIENTNNQLALGTYSILSTGELIDHNANNYRGIETAYTQNFWWGIRHTFYTDDDARGYAYDVRMAAHGQAGAAALFAVIFGGFAGIPGGLTAIYAYSVADSVDYNANLPGDGIVLDVSYILTYNCNPR